MVTQVFLQSLPKKPGVYLMKDAHGIVLYIGKAVSLRGRVSSYFQDRPRENRIQQLVGKVCAIEYLVCDSEAQALLLEASLIKERKPFYNIDLKDDKSFPWVVITRETYPRITIARPKDLAGALMIGPYPNVKLLREVLKLIRTILPFRSCKKLPIRPCLFYHVHKCPGVCIAGYSPQAYQRTVDEIVLLLRGEKDKLLTALRNSMREFSGRQKFEEAKAVRDRIFAVQRLLYGQTHALTQITTLQEALGIKKRLYRIEGYDISCFTSKEAVGSLVCFIEGVPAKNFYRRYKIKRQHRADDLGMMQEVLSRRMRHIAEGTADSKSVPGLIIVDGGAAHANMAKKVLESYRLYDMNVIGIAKKQEEVWLPNARKPILLKEGSPALILIQRIRDEAHRFARNYHLLLRKKKFIRLAKYPEGG